MTILGWDIGGVNTKSALIRQGELQRVVTHPFELQRAPDRLSALLADMARTLTTADAVHAVTMTAELSQIFRTKREGVCFVLDAMHQAFPDAPVHVYTTGGVFLSPEVARQRPGDVAAANWMATASVVSRHHPNALLIDIGTTTSDVIPIASGRVAAIGRTDPGRLASGELVYTGAVRTAVEAIVTHVPLGDAMSRVSAEGFATIGDALIWLEMLDPDDYDASTPDGRPATRVFAGERLARVVCADREMLDEQAITRMAEAIVEAQVEQVAGAVNRVRMRHPALDTAVVTGLGAFIAARAARRAGLQVVPLSGRLGRDGGRSAPAAAVGLLLASVMESVLVVKIGGSLLSDADDWRSTLQVLAAARPRQRVVVVPGGGPFADQVRSVDARMGLTDDVAHWMAIGGMDQHAEMIASLPGFVRVDDETGVRAALTNGQIPVIAPLAWMRSADPLPHSWEVTSDSIAAWLAGALGATGLVLVKPAGAAGPTAVDDHFRHALPGNLRWEVCDSSSLAALLTAPAPART